MATVVTWPSANEYMEAIQNPRTAFSDATLREGTPALTRLGMPHVASGNFAYVFKLKLTNGARAIKCFRQFLGDRERRYIAIDRHLDNHALQALAEFEYDAAGILVSGQRYPALVMDWLEGPTLDVYVEAALEQGRGREALTTLAEGWVRVVKQVESASVAHGDLQHGNVIVTGSGLRLVDLDGMYVPALKGDVASELGHVHFQHPRRTEAFFEPAVDRFPALVIYTSIIALKDAPGLWRKYHDDNLIFTKTDFKDPQRSPLFRDLWTAGSETKRLAEALAKACTDSPSSTPRLLDLVQAVDVAPSKLPGWMRQPTVVTVKTTSREADGAPVAKPAGPSPEPIRSSQPAAPVPAPAVSAQRAGVSAATTPGDPFAERIKQGGRRGFKIAFYGIFPWCFLWFPLLSVIVRDMLQTNQKGTEHWFLVVLSYVAICVVIGILLGPEKMRSPAQGSTARPSGKASTATRQSYGRATYSPPWRPSSVPSSGPYSPGPSATSGPVVVSTIRMIYHRPSCSWAMKISRRNQTSFSSAAAAASAGNRACRVCQP